jgi:protoheme IX farnesyltransferase
MTGLHIALPDTIKVSVSQRLVAYLMLTKPRVVLMVMAVTGVGFYMGTVGPPEWARLLHLLIGTALAAGGTLALNGYAEREQDALMQRTQARPLPDGRLQPRAALRFGIALTIGGLLYLAYLAHPLSALVTAVITGSYLFLYTPLKLKTSLCSIAGAIPGALPPVAGWAAARGDVSGEVWVLFAMMFLWQLPHSLAIALLYCEDYARAGFRLLPVIHPDGESTNQQIVVNSLALWAVGLLPTLVGLAGVVYFVMAFVLGLIFLGFGIALARSRTLVAARRLMFASLFYLPLAFLCMAVDKVSYL